MITKQRDIYIYEEIQNDKNEIQICLLRVYGTTQEVVIPETIGGYPVTAVGDYCFAETSHLSGEQKTQCLAYLESQQDGNSYRELAGSYILEVQLPDTVTSLGNYAFYNCKNLIRMTVGKHLEKINGDAFMNCRKLQELVVRGHVSDRTGLPMILAQLTQEIQVIFAGDGTEELPVSLLYPEFSEHYEEIGPAHIFSLQVDGEGYRARKQFRDGIVDLVGYDHVFENALPLENLTTLAKMAINRLSSPVDLREEYRKQYEDFIRINGQELMRQLVDQQQLKLLEFVCGSDFLSDEALEYGIQMATRSGWTRGCGAIIRSRKIPAADEYEF